MSEQENFQKAVELHRQGRFVEAEQFYIRAYNENPHNPDTLHLLGTLQWRLWGNFRRAFSMILESMLRYPNFLAAAQTAMRIADEALKPANTHDSGLASLKSLGFQPSAVIDIGANKGEWSRLAHAHFPQCSIIAFEPDPGNHPALQEVAKDLGSCFSAVQTLLGKEDGESDFYLMGLQSSIYPEDSEIYKYAQKTRMKIATLDSFVGGMEIGNNALMKIDVQGAELDVLGGANEVLSSNVGVIVCECSLFRINRGAPLAGEVIGYLAEKGFCIIDILEPKRNLHQNLLQVDFVFAHPRSGLTDKRVSAQAH